MALKLLELIKDKSISYIKSFINNCTIEEKIDTHYVIVEITSKQSITVKKANGCTIDKVDLILNNMWSKLINDWNYIRLANHEWFEKHVGYVFYMFFFPSQKPLQIEYKSNIRYIIDRILYNDELVDINNVINSLKLIKQFNIYSKSYLTKVSNITDICNQINGDTKSEIDYNKLFLSLIDSSNELFALNKPEGYIFKWNNTVYQYLYNEPIKIIPEKTQYEYLLCDFITYCKTKGYIDKITSSYVKTICALFNDYIINWESKRHNIENNISIEGITPPTHANNIDIGYEYIPNIVTLNLCKQSILYKRIFCVLLSNLRKPKHKLGIYMSDKQQNDLNQIIKNISIRCAHI